MFELPNRTKIVISTTIGCPNKNVKSKTYV